MSTMIAEVYNAFRDTGASDEKARAAAVALTAVDHKFDALESKFDNRFNANDLRLAKIDMELAVLRWMTVTAIVLILAVLGKLLTIR